MPWLLCLSTGRRDRKLAVYPAVRCDPLVRFVARRVALDGKTNPGVILGFDDQVASGQE